MLNGETPSPLHTSDVVSASAVFITWVSAFFGWLPVAAAVLVSLVGAAYYVLSIYTHPVVKEWYRRRRMAHIIRSKIKVLNYQLQLAREGSDAEFWRKISGETKATLGEIQEHIAMHRANGNSRSNRGEKS